MSEEINVDEVIRTIQFSEIAQKGYKVMSNDEFDRIVNGVLKLQQENQQLKEELKEIEECEDVVFNNTQFWIDKYHEVRQVLDEIRELMERYDLWKYDHSIPTFEVEKILDKVKE